jgi:tRNA threonylcarbamoyl adenosine modification protein (Sua5/YciO/YrdC/YwlC family)
MLLRIYPENPNPKHIRIVVECLMDGGIVIYPTDTVYGVGCDIFKSKAIERIAQIKGIKPEKSNFSFICNDLSQLSDYSKPIPNNIFKLMKSNLPGPFTFILNASNNVPKLIQSKKKTVGIRIPIIIFPSKLSENWVILLCQLLFMMKTDYRIYN